MQTRKIGKLLATVLALSTQYVLLCLNCFAESKYKIGIILPLSGTYATLGTSVKDGIDLAYKKLSPQDKDRIQLYFEDDQLESVKSVSAYRSLVATKSIDAVMVVGSGVGNAVGPLAERDKKVMFALGASDTGIAKDKKFIFVHWVSPQREADRLIKEVRARDLKRIVLLSNEQEGAIVLEKALLSAAKQAGIDDHFVMVERELLDNRDFHTIIAKIRLKKPDGIALTLLPGSLSTFVKQARSLGITSQIFGFELFEDPKEVTASNDTLVGSWYVNAADPNGTYADELQRFTQRQPGFGSANAHDALNLIVESVKKVGHDSHEIADNLRSTANFTGACGTYSALPGNLFDLPVAVKEVTKDGFKTLHADDA